MLNEEMFLCLLGRYIDYCECKFFGMVSLISMQVAELPTGSGKHRAFWNWRGMGTAVFKTSLHLVATSG